MMQFGYTPAMRAAENGFLRCLQWLIEDKYADVDGSRSPQVNILEGLPDLHSTSSDSRIAEG